MNLRNMTVQITRSKRDVMELGLVFAGLALLMPTSWANEMSMPTEVTDSAATQPVHAQSLKTASVSSTYAQTNDVKSDTQPTVNHSIAATSFVDGVREYNLSNGMKVLVKVDKRAPVVVSQVWYKVGSSYEHNGITGLSHMLEHMMFKGTKKLKPGEFSEIVAENGGKDNAFTGSDYTAYYQIIANDRLPKMLSLEADRMRNIRISEDEFKKELQVVKEERRWRTEDNPHALLRERFRATVFMNSPYHHPVIGWMEDLNAQTKQDALNWYARWYAPNNATLVVVGDVNPDKVYRLAKRAFGRYKMQTITAPKPQIETPQRGERQITVYGRTVSPAVTMGWKVPSLTSARNDEETNDAYALEVMASVLDLGSSARFSKELVREQQIVQSAWASYGLIDRLQTVFTLGATPTQKHSVEEAEQALMMQVERLKTELVSEQELARVKSQVLASEVYQKDSMSSQANVLGWFETVGLGWRAAGYYVPRVQAVTAQDIQRVAKRYFTQKGRTVGYLKPDESLKKRSLPFNQGEK